MYVLKALPHNAPSPPPSPKKKHQCVITMADMNVALKDSLSLLPELITPIALQIRSPCRYNPTQPTPIILSILDIFYLVSFLPLPP